MITQISAGSTQQADVVAQATATQGKTAVAITEPGGAPVPQADTVKLSLSARVHALYHQGMRPSQIAANLGISMQSISSYLPGSVLKAPVAAALIAAPTTAPAAAQGAPAAVVPAKG